MSSYAALALKQPARNIRNGLFLTDSGLQICKFSLVKIRFDPDSLCTCSHLSQALVGVAFSLTAFRLKRALLGMVVGSELI